MSNNKTALISF